MQHERADYSRIQDPAANAVLLEAYDNAMNIVARGAGAMPNPALVSLSKLCEALSPTLLSIVKDPPAFPIGQHEPVFVLRARDQLAPYLLREYARYLGQNGGGWDERNRIIQQAEAMERWALANGAKLPDAPAAIQQGI